MRFVALFLAILLWQTTTLAHGQETWQDVIEQVANLPLTEETFVIKSAENALTQRVAVMANHPDNIADGHLWMTTVAGYYYAHLALASEAANNPLAPFYREKADLIGALLKGNLTNAQFNTLERENETAKQAALEAQLAGISSPPDLSGLDHLTQELWGIINTRSMAAASNR